MNRRYRPGAQRVKLSGKVANFYWYHIIHYGFLYKELVVCRVTAGGCGHGGCLTAPPQLS